MRTKILRKSQRSQKYAHLTEGEKSDYTGPAWDWDDYTGPAWDWDDYTGPAWDIVPWDLIY